MDETLSCLFNDEERNSLEQYLTNGDSIYKSHPNDIERLFEFILIVSKSNHDIVSLAETLSQQYPSFFKKIVLETLLEYSKYLKEKGYICIGD